MLFRGELCPLPGSAEGGASSTPQYIHSAVGVFPAPLGPSTPFSVVEQVCNKFRFLGKLMAKAIMDSRMVSALDMLKGLFNNHMCVACMNFFQ